MKKKSGSRTLRVLKNILNVRAWSDWDRVKGFTYYLWNGAKKLVIPQPQQAEESFKAVKARLDLSDEDLATRQKGLLRLSLLMLGFATFMLAYAIYHLVVWNIMAFLVSVVIMGVALALAFRYHFWYFQIKRRKLGCTLQEWWEQGVRGRK